MAKHGMHRFRVYRAWEHMKGRCLNPNNDRYDRYGERGITVCDRWLEFQNFFEDMGYPPEEHSLDRIDNNGPYSPENCRWATRHQQMRNMEKTVFIEYQGETRCLAEWAEKLGIGRGVLYNRIFSHQWSVEKAFSKPVQKRRTKKELQLERKF